MMNLRDLNYLVAVADLKHFGRAAAQCFVSQPTLSNQIKRLETFLGVALLERSNKTVMLTPVGEQVVAVARQMTQGAEHIRAIAKAAADPLAGSFRLGAFPTLAPYFFPTLVPKLKSSMPNIDWVLVEDKTDHLLQQLEQGQLDAAFLALPIVSTQLKSHKCFTDPFYLAVPTQDPLARYQKLPARQLESLQLMLLQEGHCLRHQALEVCAQIGAGEAKAFRATSLETLRQMVALGSGMTLIPAIARRELDEGIHYIALQNPTPKREIALVWRKSSVRTAVIERLCDLQLSS